jgi:tetratricopeptide (TPR) repeat protein
MQRNWDISVIVRLLLILVGVIVLGVTPEHTTYVFIQQVNQAVQHESPAEAARLTAEIAQQIPWRDDLWGRAGVFAWQAGDYPSTIEYLEQAALSTPLSSENKLHLADAYLSQGEVNKAENLLLEVRHDKPTHQVYVLFSRFIDGKKIMQQPWMILSTGRTRTENANLLYVSGFCKWHYDPIRRFLLDKPHRLTPFLSYCICN